MLFMMAVRSEDDLERGARKLVVFTTIVFALRASNVSMRDYESRRPARVAVTGIMRRHEKAAWSCELDLPLDQRPIVIFPQTLRA
jgi:hypothetical protein